MSHLQCIRVAPQRCKRWNCRLATHGHSPRRALIPPTILCWPNSGRWPQSVGRNHEIRVMKCLFSCSLACCGQLIFQCVKVCFCTSVVLVHNIKLTAVFLISFIGAVGDSVTFRVDLADTHSSTTVKVSTAVYST